MPVLKTERETRKINLITDTDAWVEVYTKQTYREYLAIQGQMMGDVSAEDLGKTKMKVDVSAFMLATLETMVKAWNYTDEAGVALPVNRETILAMDVQDASHIFNEISESGANGLPQDEDSKNLEKNS